MTDISYSLHSRFRRINRNRHFFLFGLFAAMLASLVLDLQAGPAGLPIGAVLQGLLDPEALELRHRVILWDVRLPDALIAIAIGAALGLAGIETQTILDNPLASPFTLGVSSAAVLGASLVIVVAPAVPLIPPTAILPVLALGFALASGGLILAVVQWTGGLRETVVLFGIAMVFLCNALTAALQYIADAEAVQEIVFWTVGNLTKAGWIEVSLVSLVFVLLLPFSLRQVWLMTLLRGGEAHARAVGINIPRLRFWVIMRISILSAFAVCFVGAIGFIGLVGPHIARMILGEDHRILVPGSALCGALILSLASWLSKSLIPGVIIPVGILTALIGVPVFLSLLSARRNKI